MGDIIANYLTFVLMESSNASYKHDVVPSAKKCKKIAIKMLQKQLTKLANVKRNVVKNKNYFVTITSMSENTFFSHFRMTRSCFKILVDELSPKLQYSKGRPKQKIEHLLYITLWMLANENCYREVSDRFDVSYGKVVYVFIKMCKLICALREKYIKWPSDEEIFEISKAFENKRQPNALPGVVGCIDGTHVRIKAPQNDPQSYYNRKGYHSLILQCICDHNLIIRDAFFGFPGSCHDARVWESSPICQAINNGTYKLPENIHLLGDAAYPLLPHLITPFRDNGFLCEREKNFNYKHSSTRVCIEQAFGVLKAKFRSINYLKINKLKNAKFIVIATIVLHNLCRMNSTCESGEYIETPDEPTEQPVENSPHSPDNTPDRLDGVVKRQILAEWMFPI